MSQEAILDTDTQLWEDKAICKSEQDAAYSTPMIKPVTHSQTMNIGSEDEQHHKVAVEDTTEHPRAFTADDWAHSISGSSSASIHHD